MAKSEIRLKYPGLVVFASNLLSVATGLVFILMITRNVSTEEFGIWGNINDVFGYFILLAGVIPFWATRFVAREHARSAKTGLIANLFISIPVAFVYLALLPIILAALQIGSAYTILYIVLSVQILGPYTIYALEAVLRVKQPQTIGYGLLVYEVFRVVLGFILIIHLKLGLLGAIYSIIGSFLIQIAFYIKLLAKELKEDIKWSYLKEWLKASSINIYGIIGNKIAAFTFIFLFVYGGELARAYYGVATTVAKIIGYSSFLAFALYPRLLSGGRPEDVPTSLKMVTMFAIPMAAGAIVLSDSYLTILRFVYAEAGPVLIILAINYLLVCISGVFGVIVFGTERVDVEARIPFRKLIRSRLFLLYTLPYVESAVTLPTTFFLLTSIAKTSLEAATYLALITLLASSTSLIFTYAIARRCLVFSLPWNNFLKYILASAVMATVLLVAPHPTTLSITVAVTLLGAAIYIAVLWLIDKEVRSLIKSTLQEARYILHLK